MTTGFIIGFLICSCAVFSNAQLDGDNGKYSNLWVAKIEGGEDVAQRIARDLGYHYKSQCGQLENYYELIKEGHPEVSLRGSDHLTTYLLDLDEVKWAKQQVLVKPVPHSIFFWKDSDEEQQQNILTFMSNEARKQAEDKDRYSNCKSMFSCISFFPPSISYILLQYDQWNIGTLGTIPTTPAPEEQLQTYSKDPYYTNHIYLLWEKISAYLFDYSDPGWRYQWYMHDYRTREMPVMDINVVPVHRMGYTGKRVTIAIVDNGVQHDNVEFTRNFISRLSYDMCNDLPGSRPDGDSHGTISAGIIAMNPNNNLCGVGIAYDANIVGIRAICGADQEKSFIAKALIHGINEIDIYSNSWGLDGVGRYVFPRDQLADEAYYQGVTKGRNGKGAIYIHSSGNDNGVRKFDNCAVDPYINSPYVITIAAADQKGREIVYSEECSAVMATAYSKGDYARSDGIVGPTIDGGCIADFNGTSPACSQASGIVALVLEANSDLTYRDVMHLITVSAEVAPLASNKCTWYKNGAGFWVSTVFGFGLMNAENMVRLAERWQNVPTKGECVIPVDLSQPQHYDINNCANITIDTSSCQGTHEINYLEHVELISTVDYTTRGEIVIYIQSPAGTKTQLLKGRKFDTSPNGYEGLDIVSVQYWGENPKGTWSVSYEASGIGPASHGGWVHGITLKLHGTKSKPAHYNKPRVYAAFRLPDGKTS